MPTDFYGKLDSRLIFRHARRRSVVSTMCYQVNNRYDHSLIVLRQLIAMYIHLTFIHNQLEIYLLQLMSCIVTFS